jgi:hypothetical protein
LGHSKAHFVESRWHEQGELYGQLLDNLELSESFPFLRRTDRSRSGSVTFDLGTDQKVEELRLSIQAGSSEDEEPRNVVVEAHISMDRGDNWERLARFGVDPEHQKPWMWFNHIITDSDLNGGHIRLKVVVENGSLAAIKAGCRLSAASLNPSDLALTHVWSEGDRSHSAKSVLPATADSHTYTVNTSDHSKLINRHLIIEALPAGTAHKE